MYHFESIQMYNKNVKKKNQEVTIFMLTHNREHYLKLAIDSVLNQTYKNFCLIILDNCSIDNTKAMVEQITDERVIYIYRESHNDFLNIHFAFQECITKFLIVLHDDDVLEPTYLDEILNVICNSDYSAVSVASRYIDENGIRIAGGTESYHDEIFSGTDYIKRFYSRNPLWMVYPSVIYRKEFYFDYKKFIGIMEAGPSNDQLVWFQTERYGGKLYFINKPLMNYRIHTNQDSSINQGFMDVQLLDYLLEDEYYKKIIGEVASGVRWKVWHAFTAVAKKYYRGIIGLDKFESFMKFKYIQEMQKSFPGKVQYITMLFFYKCKGIARLIVKIHEKLYR